MDGAPGTNPLTAEKDTGAVGIDLEGIFPLQIAGPYRPVADLKMAGDPVDIIPIEIEAGARQAITAVPRTEGAVGGISRQAKAALRTFSFAIFAVVRSHRHILCWGGSISFWFRVSALLGVYRFIPWFSQEINPSRVSQTPFNS
jgi:hypothetical protein